MASNQPTDRRKEGKSTGTSGRRARVPLVDVCREGRKFHAQRYLENGSKVNEVDQYGRTALHTASSNGHKDIILLLLYHNADVNAQKDDGTTPLIEASKNDQYIVVRLLLIFGANVNVVDAEGKGALVWALENGFTKTIQELIRHPQTDVNLYSNGTRPLHVAVNSGYSDDVELLFKECNNLLSVCAYLNVNAKDANGDTPLHVASRCSFLPMVQILLANRADVRAVNKAGNSAFHLACDYRVSSEDIIQEFVERKPDVNAKNSEGSTGLHLLTVGKDVGSVKVLLESSRVDVDVNIVDRNGCTTLLIACEKGHTDIARVLLEHGADVNIPNKAGYTPLHGACIYGRNSIVERLLSHPRIDINARDVSGKPALSLACERQHATIAAALIRHKADVSLADDRNRTPLYFACLYSVDDTVKALLQAGCQTDVVSRTGCTPLYVACLKGHKQVVMSLVRHKADVNYVNPRTGMTSLQLAVHAQHVDIADFLVSSARCGNTPLKAQGHCDDCALAVETLTKNNVDTDISDNAQRDPSSLN